MSVSRTVRASFVNGRRLLSSAASESESSHIKPPREFKVILDNETLYIDKSLAEALGWKPEIGPEGVPLTLNGWSPNYFAIARTGTDSGTLALTRAIAQCRRFR